MYLLEQMGGSDTVHFQKSDIEASMKNWAITHGSNLDGFEYFHEIGHVFHRAYNRQESLVFSLI